MSENTEGTRTVRLCSTDALYTGTGHPLWATYYNYDGEGYITDTLREFYFCDDKTVQMGFPMRGTYRDAYDIIMSEEIHGEDGVSFDMPRVVLYERDESGLVRRATTAAVEAGTQRIFPIIHHIEYLERAPHRRGVVMREEELTPTGNFRYERRYDYDDHGRRVRTYGRASPKEPFKLQRERVFTYDNQGNPTYCDNGFQFKMENTYDEEGLLQEVLVWEKDLDTGDWYQARRHIYEYEEVDLDLPPEP